MSIQVTTQVTTEENSGIELHRNHEEVIQVLRVRQRIISDPNLTDAEGINTSFPEANSFRSPLTNTGLDDTEEIIEGRFSESISIFPLYSSQQETTVGTDTEVTPKSTLVSSLDKTECKFKFTRIRSKGRAQSAPPRPLTELEDIRNTVEFECLEFAVMNVKQFVYKRDGKFNFESLEGFYFFTKFLETLERLATLLKVKPLNRVYRTYFSQPYKYLYRNYESFCYLTEIIESAQERLPFIVVNGEKYIFSPNILKHGEELLRSFINLKDFIFSLHNAFFDENLTSSYISKRMHELQSKLKEFDKKWVTFEKLYIFELMLIERDARRLLFYAIGVDQKMKALEMTEKFKGSIVIRSPSYDLMRKCFLEICGRINSIANYMGKGRDDLSIDILIAAENISRRITDSRSKAVRKLASRIKGTFDALRLIFRKYSESIETVNPELSSNQDLVEALVDFEKAWEKGKDYLLEPNITKMLLNVSEYIEELSQRRNEIRDKLETMDADVFLIIPCLIILRSLDTNNVTLYKLYYPEVQKDTKEAEDFSKLRKLYNSLKRKMNDNYELYNKLEQMILEQNHNNSSENINRLLHEIKKFAILIQRNKPTDWNSFMEIVMGRI